MAVEEMPEVQATAAEGDLVQVLRVGLPVNCRFGICPSCGETVAMFDRNA